MPTNLLLMDVDGVLTDGTKVYGPDGKVIGKRFCDQDFTAIKCFVQAGWVPYFISADNNINQAIARDRGIAFEHSRDENGIIDKVAVVEKIIAKFSDPVCYYIGDDFLDIPVIEYIVDIGGKAYTTADGASILDSIGVHRLRSRGGDKAIMELLTMFYGKRKFNICV